MVPDPQLQLAVVIKALREVVVPAIPPANPLAAEQLHLAIATLGLVHDTLPLNHKRVRRELLNAIMLAEGVEAADDMAGLADEIAAARNLMEDARADEAMLEELRGALLSATERAVAKAAPMRQASVARAVVAGSRAQFDLARAWCLSAGFEPDLGKCPPLDQQLEY